MENTNFLQAKRFSSILKCAEVMVCLMEDDAISMLASVHSGISPGSNWSSR